MGTTARTRALWHIIELKHKDKSIPLKEEKNQYSIKVDDQHMQYDRSGYESTGNTKRKV